MCRLSLGPTPEAPPTVEAPLFVATMHGLRGAAVLAVVLYHIAGGTLWVPDGAIARALYEAGFVSVYVLFFTTGFVLFLPVVLNGTVGSSGFLQSDASPGSLPRTMSAPY